MTRRVHLGHDDAIPRYGRSHVAVEALSGR
jgi:hypothetical protein